MQSQTVPGLIFAKTYLTQMEQGFTTAAMVGQVDGQKARLYFDRNFGEAYDQATAGRFSRTPLLGHSPYPVEKVDYRGDGLKHRWLADYPGSASCHRRCGRC